ncbi:MAG: hypothetical protein NT154_13735, partial [Verrucomicrobia bacterium]|nr:hypothetical protein [Verrucomicrobiota bacterium]
PAFQRWLLTRCGLSPEGTVDKEPDQPSLRYLGISGYIPSVETLGYSQASLRDEDVPIVVA